MLNLRISINDNVITSAGLSDVGNISAITTILNSKADEDVTSKCFLEIAGLDRAKSEIVNWPSSTLKSGDTIRIEISDVFEIDSPISKKAIDSNESRLKQKLELYKKIQNELRLEGLI